MLKRILFILGPTAVGKTEASVYLARKLKAEIISLDSMQIYKGMKVITSKPPVVLRKGIKHHLINFQPLNKEYNVNQYCQDALKKVNFLVKRGKLPIFVGGTGLYATMLLDGIFNVKKPNKNIRKRLYGLSDKYGKLYLYNRLKRVDFEAARKIHPHDLRRIVRALEVFEASGKPISALQRNRIGLRHKFDVKVFCLNIKREELYNRINQRVDDMFKQGLVNEVKSLEKRCLSRTASVAIGIKEIKGFINGVCSLEEAKLLIKRNTRRYAKRQLTYFRKDKSIKWINLVGKESPTQVANIIWKKLY